MSVVWYSPEFLREDIIIKFSKTGWKKKFSNTHIIMEYNSKINYYT